MILVDQIRTSVESALAQGTRADVRDSTGTGDHFELLVVSPAFEGKRPVERHRMVYAAIGASVGNEIHALQLRTLTPAEAEKGD